MAGSAECCAVITIHAGGHSCCSAADSRPLLEEKGGHSWTFWRRRGRGTERRLPPTVSSESGSILLPCFSAGAGQVPFKPLRFKLYVQFQCFSRKWEERRVPLLILRWTSLSECDSGWTWTLNSLLRAAWTAAVCRILNVPAVYTLSDNIFWQSEGSPAGMAATHGVRLRWATLDL